MPFLRHGAVQPQVPGSFKSAAPEPIDPSYMFRPESSSMLMTSPTTAAAAAAAAAAPWTNNNVQTISFTPLPKEGVLFAKKDFNLAKHPLIESVPNLQVIKLMQSFKSKEYVRETFAWMHYYWFLTNEGIEFLRTYLNLPSDVVPATLKKSAKPIGRPFGGPPGDRPRGPRFEGGDRPRYGDRDGYRGGPRGGEGEKGGAPADYQPSFQGSGGRPGFGRGAGGYSAAAPSGSGLP
ncbi:hypothetical protein Bca4012_017314 [Brassica carinata]